MGQVLNLAPLFSAQRITGELLERCGVEYFILPEAEGPSFRLDPQKLQRVVDLAEFDAEQEMPWLPVEESDLTVCRRMLRRDLIHHLALGMLEAGL